MSNTNEALAIAVGQARVPSCDVPAAVAVGLHLAELASERRVQLLVLPELFLSGYVREDLKANLDRAVVEPAGAELAPMRNFARDHTMAIVVGGVTKRAGHYYNSAIAINEKGEIASIYDKIHLWKYETDLFSQGEFRSIVRLSGVSVGLAVCYDAGFPEHVRALALEGAEILACPTAFVEGSERARYDIYWQARALENTIFVAAANLVDDTSDGYFGESKIVGPLGDILSEADKSDGIRVAEYNHRAIVSARDEVPYLADLRRDLGEGVAP